MVEALLLGLGVILGAAVVYFAVVRGLHAKAQENAGAVVEAATLKERVKNLEEGHADWIKDREDAEQKLTNTFKALSGDALKDSNKEFIERADLRLKPLEDQLRLYEKGLQELRDIGTRQTTETQEQLKHLLGELDRQRQLAGDIKSLMRGPTQRGRMGEMMLEVLLEEAGLVANVHYELQPPSDIEGARRKPDCKVFIPGDRAVVIDSKTPLNAYLEAIESEDEAFRKAKFVEHAKNVRREIDSLSSKDYKQEAGEGTMVVMYLPIEASYSAANLIDLEIFSYGRGKNVLVATPSLLFAYLQTVMMAWRHEQFRQNTERVAELGKELGTRIRVVATHMNKLGDNLGKSVTAYNDAIGSIDRNLLATANKFRQLGVSGDALPVMKEATAVVRTFDKPELLIPPDEGERIALTDLFTDSDVGEPAVPPAESE